MQKQPPVFRQKLNKQGIPRAPFSGSHLTRRIHCAFHLRVNLKLGEQFQAIFEQCAHESAFCAVPEAEFRMAMTRWAKG